MAVIVITINNISSNIINKFCWILLISENKKLNYSKINGICILKIRIEEAKDNPGCPLDVMASPPH